MAVQEKDERLDADDLIEKWIEPNPHRAGGGYARVKAYGVSVWILVSYLQGPGADIAKAAQDYDMPEEAVQAALAYYERNERNKILIDDRLDANIA